MSKNIEEKVKVIIALDKARGSAPIGYVAQKCGIEDLRGLLRQLEEDGIICCPPSGSWSASLTPQYELTSKAKKLLQQLVSTRLEPLIDVRT